MAVIAFRDGDPRKVLLLLLLLLLICWPPIQVLYPTNSRGEICGQGEFKEKAFMMMFDLSRCCNTHINYTEENH